MQHFYRFLNRGNLWTHRMAFIFRVFNFGERGPVCGVREGIGGLGTKTYMQWNHFIFKNTKRKKEKHMKHLKKESADRYMYALTQENDVTVSLKCWKKSSVASMTVQWSSKRRHIEHPEHLILYRQKQKRRITLTLQHVRCTKKVKKLTM